MGGGRIRDGVFRFCVSKAYLLQSICDDNNWFVEDRASQIFVLIFDQIFSRLTAIVIDTTDSEGEFVEGIGFYSKEVFISEQCSLDLAAAIL